MATIGGRLEMLKVNLADGYETAIEQRIGVALPVSWVSVPNPDPRPITTTVDGVAAAGVFRQGLAAGGAVFRRLEGIWFSQGKFYFTATSGGDACLGQIWVYDPKLETLTLVFETPNQRPKFPGQHCRQSTRRPYRV
ncbi:MAG: alkaline phosphatase PhoX [Bryobacteraceae bacterium]